jgi:dephospho-CoA kinase
VKAIGLTGGIGMGKSVASEILSKRGISVIDTDTIARQIVEPGQPALAEVVKAFGRDVIGSDGRLQRDRLAQRVFGDEAARKRLEGILHPQIRAVWRGQLERWKQEGQRAGIVVIPLLYETKAEEHFDEVICLACSTETQNRRLLERGWSSEQIKQRLAAQLPTETKMGRADYVIWTEGSIEVTGEQLAKVVLLE